MDIYIDFFFFLFLNSCSSLFFHSYSYSIDTLQFSHDASLFIVLIATIVLTNYFESPHLAT